jgi:predicted nucleotidyltransferase
MRAWGFESTDSDYDVRFIYAHQTEWYLSIRKRRDVIEKMMGKKLDFAGWDLPKALHLYSKSNPPLFEWLQSPIVYIETGRLARPRAAYSVHFGFYRRAVGSVVCR